MKELEQNKKSDEEKLGGKELYDLSKRQKEESKKQEQRKEMLSEAPKKIVRYILYSLIGIGVVGGLIWYGATRPPVTESEIVSRNGIHWHPELSIMVKGVKQEIPTNLGVGESFMSPVHTHDTSGVIHLEFQGLVHKSDITLGQFFKSWSRDMRSFGANMKMTVNGEENTEYENYVMHDKDKIELRYE